MSTNSAACHRCNDSILREQVTSRREGHSHLQIVFCCLDRTMQTGELFIDRADCNHNEWMCTRGLGTVQERVRLCCVRLLLREPKRNNHQQKQHVFFQLHTLSCAVRRWVSLLSLSLLRRFLTALRYYSAIKYVGRLKVMGSLQCYRLTVDYSTRPHKKTQQVT